MTAKNSASVTPADVAAKAVEEKLVVPNQGTPEQEAADAVDEVFSNSTEGSAEDQSTKKTLKERISALRVKAGQHRKVLIAAGIVSGTAAIAYIKFIKKTVEEMSDEDKAALDQAKADAESIADMG